MSLEDNLPPILRSRKKRRKSRNSLETPRALLGKVIDEKINRNSSTFVFNAQLNNIVSTNSPKLRKSTSVKPVHENIQSSDSDENITEDYLLIGNEERNMCVKRNAPTRSSPSKRKFKFSRVPNQALQSLHNVEEISPSKVVNKRKVSKNNSLKEKSSKIKPLEHYFNSSHQNKSSQEGMANVEIMCKNSIIDKHEQSKNKSVDRSIGKRNLTLVNDKTQSISITTTKSFAEARKKMSVTITPLSRSSAFVSKEQVKSANTSSVSLISNKRNNEDSENNILRVNQPSGNSLRLGRKRNSNCALNTEQDPNSSPSQHEHASVSPPPSLMSNIQCKEIQSIKPTKTKKIPKENELDVFSQMLGDDGFKPTSHAHNLHSTAININTQTLGFDASLIEPVAGSSATSDRISKPQLNISNHEPRDENESGNSGLEVMEQDQLQMELGASSSIENIILPNIPRIPDNITRHIMQHFLEMPIAPSSMSVVNACCDDFWKQTLDTLQVYAEHSGRQTINVADVEVLLYRQGFVRDRSSLNALIEQYLPLDLSSEIISSATAGNHV